MFIKDMHRNVHCSIIHNSLKIEKTHMPVKGGTDKYTDVFIEWNTVHNENQLAIGRTASMTLTNVM